MIDACESVMFTDFKDFIPVKDSIKGSTWVFVAVCRHNDQAFWMKVTGLMSFSLLPPW
jgi:hypothetical protein